MLTITQYAKKWNMTRARVHSLVLQRRIPGAVRTQVLGGNRLGVWMIPESSRIMPIKRNGK